MNRYKDEAGNKMAALTEAIMDDILAASDEQILAEYVEDGVDPAAATARMRSSALVKLRA